MAETYDLPGRPMLVEDIRIPVTPALKEQLYRASVEQEASMAHYVRQVLKKELQSNQGYELEILQRIADCTQANLHRCK